MTDPTPDSVTERKRWLADQYADALEMIAKGTRNRDDIASELLAACQPGERIETRPGADGKMQGVRIQAPSMTFNAALAKKILTPDQYASICEPKPSAKLASDMLANVVVDMCRKPTANPTVHLL